MTNKTIKIFYKLERDTETCYEKFETHVATLTNMRSLEEAYALTQNVSGSWSGGKILEDGRVNPQFDVKNLEVIGNEQGMLVYHDDLQIPVKDGRINSDERSGIRSSSVGDIFEVDGKRFMVADIGFVTEDTQERVDPETLQVQ